MVFSLIWFSNSKSHWKFFTSQERCTLYLEVSKDFISLAPFLPWMNDSQLCLAPTPTGVTNPNPVITIFDIVFVFKLGIQLLIFPPSMGGLGEGDLLFSFTPTQPPPSMG